jgi:hypothetical protein
MDHLFPSGFYDDRMSNVEIWWSRCRAVSCERRLSYEPSGWTKSQSWTEFRVRQVTVRKISRVWVGVNEGWRWFLQFD